MRLIVIFASLLLVPASLFAQHAKPKGKKCGDSYIDPKKECHLPTSPGRSAALMMITLAPSDTAWGLITLAPSDTAWVGFTLSGFVFPNHPQCQAGRLMAPEHRKLFPTHAAAKAAGYQDVGNPECQVAKP